MICMPNSYLILRKKNTKFYTNLSEAKAYQKTKTSINNIFIYSNWKNNNMTDKGPQTFKLPQQEQGVSIFESISSSWHILHSTIFPAVKTAAASWDEQFGVTSLVIHDANWFWFLLSIAASKVDSVSNRSTRKTKWSPILWWYV